MSSSDRVTAALEQQRAAKLAAQVAADIEARRSAPASAPRLTPEQQRQANPKCRADKSVLRGSGSRRR